MNTDFFEVAPELENHRIERYTGQDLGTDLARLDRESAAALREVYTILTEILQVAEKASARELVEAVRSNHCVAGLMGSVEKFRKAGERAAPSLSEPERTRLHKNLHDIRGGALAVLVVKLEWLTLPGMTPTEDQRDSVFFLARDHLKIMRNCFKDLDPERRMRDLSEHPHTTELIREKWDGFSSNGKSVRFRGSYSGAIASCCLEFSTVDRVIYNLVNNAVRHGEGEEIEMIMAPDRDTDPGNLLFVVRNPISETGEAKLNAAFGERWWKLFHGGFTTDGTGLGMRICADCVGRAYGVLELEELVREGYLGVRRDESGFSAWFFWPLMPEE